MPSASQAGTGRTIPHTSVDLAFAERVREAAEAEDRSVSYILRRAIARELTDGPEGSREQAQ